jgi:hypothetical protein
MKTILTMLALLCATSSAFAGSTTCQGEVVVGPEWTTITEEDTLPKGHPYYVGPTVCRFKTASPHGKRILRQCPNGSTCTLDLSIDNNPKDHRKEGKFETLWTIIKWPEHGVERN